MMDEVTTQDLRDAIEVYWNAPYYEDEDDRLNREGRRDVELAAFDKLEQDATRYRKIKAISQKHGGIDICESPGMVDVFHTGLDAGHKAPTFDQAIDEVVE